MRYLGREFLLSDEFYHYQEWPVYYRALFFKHHKNRRERFQLWLFFWANGMRPDRAVYWVMWHGGYDRSAHSSMQDLVRMALNNPSYFRRFPVHSLEQYR